jgi:hypothetical protein
MVVVGIYAIIFWAIAQYSSPKKQIFSSKQLLEEESITVT